MCFNISCLIFIACLFVCLFVLFVLFWVFLLLFVVFFYSPFCLSFLYVSISLYYLNLFVCLLVYLFAYSFIYSLIFSLIYALLSICLPLLRYLFFSCINSCACASLPHLSVIKSLGVSVCSAAYHTGAASLAEWLRRLPRERKIPGSNPACGGIFSGSSHTNDFKIGTPVATLPGAWRYRVSAGSALARCQYTVTG